MQVSLANTHQLIEPIKPMDSPPMKGFAIWGLVGCTRCTPTSRVAWL